MNPRALLGANLLLLIWLGAACALMVLPASVHQQAQNFLRDFTAPGLGMAHALKGLLPERQQLAGFQKAGETETIDSGSRQKIEQLEREIASLKDLLNKQQLWKARSPSGLFQPELITARELLEDQKQRWRTSHWIDAGSKQSLSEQNWVLKSELPVIDLGADYQIEPDQLLLSGRQIIGQIDRTGLWSSTYRPVTHAEFRCPALVMNSQTGLRNENSAGSLHGLGEELCELKYIENTHPVNVGDFVVLADPERRFDIPLILGKVAEAKVLANSPFWEIQVEPVPLESSSRLVHVLIERLNTARLSTR